MKVAIIMGSNSDWPILEPAEKTLKEFGVEVEVVVASAHRTPNLVHEFAAGARERGVEVIIAAAGLAAHLGGVIAAFTTVPVIGIPIAGGPLNGVDALLSFVQMPPGIPVATMAINGAKNAANFTWLGPVHKAWGITSPKAKINVTEITTAKNLGTILSKKTGNASIANEFIKRRVTKS